MVIVTIVAAIVVYRFEVTLPLVKLFELDVGHSHRHILAEDLVCDAEGHVWVVLQVAAPAEELGRRDEQAITLTVHLCNLLRHILEAIVSSHNGQRAVASAATCARLVARSWPRWTDPLGTLTDMLTSVTVCLVAVHFFLR